MYQDDDMNAPIDAPLERQERVRLQLEADGRGGLYQLLEQAQGQVLAGRFGLQQIWAAGRQVFVWRALDQKTNQPVIVKQAAFDFRSPLQYSRKEAFRLRGVLRFEHEVQSSCTTGHMSKPIALVVCDSVIPAAKESRVLGREEVFSVEEWLEAKSLYEVALTSQSESPKEREKKSAMIASEFVSFWEALYDAGWAYTDVNSYNLMLENGTGKLRVVDAGSVLAASPEINLTGISPAFSTPVLWESVQNKKMLPGTLALVLPPLAKVLHFLLTKVEPVNGQLPTLLPEQMNAFHPTCLTALQRMLALDSSWQEINAAKEAISAWRDANS